MRYSAVARLIHWTMAVLILITIPVGLTMTGEDLARPVQDRLFITHKGIGALLLVLTAIRIVWRALHPPPPLPATLPALQRAVATTVHLGLYLLIVVMTVSGYVRVIAGGFPIELLDVLGIPPLLAKNEPLAETAKAIHAFAKYPLLVLLVLHIGAGLFHLLVARDGVFQRMWPPFPTAAARR